MPDLTTASDAGALQSTDKIVVIRGTTAYTITIAELASTFQDALSASQGELFGRTASGSGAPQPVGLGPGLGIGGGELLPNGDDHLSFAILETMDLSAEFIVNSAGSPARIPFALVRALLLAAGQPLTNVAWVTSAQPSAALGALGDMSLDITTVSGSLVVWQRHGNGWSPIGQIALSDISFDFSSAANSGLIPTL